MKLLTVVVSLVFLAGKSDLKPIVEKEVCSNGWKQMGSEKCFKLLEVFESWQGAHDLCSDLADGQNKSTLATIHSEQEQKFIRDWLYEEKGVEDIVWIGAKRVNSVSEFRYIPYIMIYIYNVNYMCFIRFIKLYLYLKVNSILALNYIFLFL